MVAKKRSGSRVTPRKSSLPSAQIPPTRHVAARKQRPAHEADGEPTAPGRYTRPAPKVRFRPRWHRVAGWVGVAIGLIVVALNDVMLMGENLTLLPFGHSELYLMLGVAIAAASTWFLGVWDRETTIYG